MFSLQERGMGYGQPSHTTTYLAPQATVLQPVNAVYYPNWRVYNDQHPSSLNLDYITHILYAFFWVKADGTIYSSDEQADFNADANGSKGALADLKRLKTQRPNIKTLLSIGGGGTGSDNFVAATRTGQTLNRLTATAKNFVDKYGFDGIDVDWEHPETPEQGRQYLNLLSALRYTFPRPRYLVTTAIPGDQGVLENIKLRQVIQYLDWINLMTYDFAGYPYTDKAGNQAQLYTPADPYNYDAILSCDSAVRYMRLHGVPASKIVMGIPTYGRSFLGAQKPGDAYNGTGGDDGTFEYRDLPRPGSKVVYDEKLGATYCVGGDGGFVSYDDQRCVVAKAAYAKQNKLAGLFYWTGTGDTNDARSLVATGSKGLRR